MNDLNEIREELTEYTYMARLKKLVEQKKKNIVKLKRAQRTYVAAKIEKRRIGKEVRALREEWQRLCKENPGQAKQEFDKMVKSVGSEDIYPKDLEEEFNQIDHDHRMGKDRMMKVADLSNDLDVKAPKISVSELRDMEDEEMEVIVESKPEDEIAEALSSTDGDVGFSDEDIHIDDDGNETEGE